MKVSVIIPIYNGEKYLRQCMDSVINQDICSKEIICVDDGSKDMSVQIIQEYQEKYPYIKLVQQTNQGAAIARNNALEIATGKYIAFMDADDFYLDSTGLRMMVDASEASQSVICGSFRMAVREGVYRKLDTFREDFIDITSPQKLQYLDYQLDYDYQSFIYLKEFLDKNKLRFPDLRRYQDPPFLVEAMWFAKEFIVVPVELYCYRSRSISMKFSFIQANHLLKGIKQNIIFAKEHKLDLLYERCIKRLNEEYFYVLSDTIFEGNMTAVKELIEISELIQEKNQSIVQYDICLVNEIKNQLHQTRFAKQEEYLFPYEEIAKNSCVAVYGAGNAGRGIVSKINSENYCSLSIWVDKNYDVYQERGRNIQSPNSLLEVEFDYLLVGVESETIFAEIKKTVLENGWNKGKKIIGPVLKRTK